MKPDMEGGQHLRVLFGRLAEDTTSFLAERLLLLEDEWRAEIQRLRMYGLKLAIGFFLALVGVELLAAAVVILFTPLVPMWALFLLPGLFLLLAGAAIVWWQTRAGGRTAHPFDHTLAEVRKDLQWMSGNR